jgi:hypothetical protein
MILNSYRETAFMIIIIKSGFAIAILNYRESYLFILFLLFSFFLSIIIYLRLYAHDPKAVNVRSEDSRRTVRRQ